MMAWKTLRRVVSSDVARFSQDVCKHPGCVWRYRWGRDRVAVANDASYFLSKGKMLPLHLQPLHTVTQSCGKILADLQLVRIINVLTPINVKEIHIRLHHLSRRLLHNSLRVYSGSERSHQKRSS